MEWILIIQQIITMIQDCQKNRTAAAIEAGMNNPGLQEWWAIRSILKNEPHNLSGRDLRGKTREGMDELRSLEPEDVADIMAMIPPRAVD